jgi:AraC-like DNA-binding protein
MLSRQLTMDQKPFYQKQPGSPLGLLHPIVYSDSALRFYNFHWHSFIEIVYGLREKIWISVDGRPYEVHPRDMVFVNSGSIHGYWGASPGAMIGLLEARSELLDDLPMDEDYPVPHNRIFRGKVFFSPAEDGKIHRRLEECFLAIQDESRNPKKGGCLALKARFYEMALVFLRELPESGDSRAKATEKNAGFCTNHEVLERIFSFIHEKYRNSGFNLDEMADFAGMSKFYFNRFFRKHTGQTFHKYLSSLRIAHAKESLVESNHTVLDIALTCGFGSKETFNRLFKQHTGIVPSLYRGTCQSLTHSS